MRSKSSHIGVHPHSYTRDQLVALGEWVLGYSKFRAGGISQHFQFNISKNRYAPLLEPVMHYELHIHKGSRQYSVNEMKLVRQFMPAACKLC